LDVANCPISFPDSNIPNLAVAAGCSPIRKLHHDSKSGFSAAHFATEAERENHSAGTNWAWRASCGALNRYNQG
jgi:hypothetical protein